MFKADIMYRKLQNILEMAKTRPTTPFPLDPLNFTKKCSDPLDIVRFVLEKHETLLI